jgi:ribonuclease J
MRQSNDLIEATKTTVRNALASAQNNGNADAHEVDSAFVNRKIKDVVSEFLYKETRRRPMVIPVVMEV